MKILIIEEAIKEREKLANLFSERLKEDPENFYKELDEYIVKHAVAEANNEIVIPSRPNMIKENGGIYTQTLEDNPVSTPLTLTLLKEVIWNFFYGKTKESENNLNNKAR